MDFGGRPWTSTEERPVLLLSFWTSIDVGGRYPTSPQVLGSNPRGRTFVRSHVTIRHSVLPRPPTRPHWTLRDENGLWWFTEREWRTSVNRERPDRSVTLPRTCAPDLPVETQAPSRRRSVDGSGGHDPHAGLAGQLGDELEVVVVVQQREPRLLGGRRDQQVRHLAPSLAP